MTRDSAQATPAVTDAARAPAESRSTVERAERAFAAGDYRALRQLLPSLQTEPTRERAERWARSIAVDPVQLAVLAACALALAAIAIRYGAS
jgi:hypothetical protein